MTNYIDYVKGAVAEARSELKANNNRRPSTEYSVDDIVFSIARFLPNWVYPQSVWKETPITRRRNIAKALRTSPLVARPRVVRIRDEATVWAQDSLDLLANKYTDNTIDNLDSLLKSAEDFVTSATDVELMDPLFLTTGYVTLDDAVSNFIRGNKEEFTSALDQVNSNFNAIVNLAGDLRRSLESIRDDAVEHTKLVRNELFNNFIEQRLRHLSYHIRTVLQNLSEEIREIPEGDKEASKVLRKHTADALRSEIESLNDIKMTCQRTKSYLVKIWDNTSKELTQSPLSLDYWVDTLAEIREAFVELGNSLVKRYHNRHYQKCTCGYHHA